MNNEAVGVLSDGGCTDNEEVPGTLLLIDRSKTFVNDLPDPAGSMPLARQ